MTAYAVRNVLDNCLGVQPGEEILLITDAATDQGVVRLLADGIAQRNAVAVIAEIPAAVVPGTEPPNLVAAGLRSANAAIELTSVFIGSSRARQKATAVGTRYLAMPGVEVSTFRETGPLTVDFEAIRTAAEVVGAAWEAGHHFRLTTPGGTDLHGSIEGRPGRVLHGIARASGDYMAPPDIEAGTAPVEGTTSGVVVVDADLLFMGQGPLDEPVVIVIAKGRVVAIDGPESYRLTDMIDRCDDARMTNLAEVSMGLNPRGSVCSVPMETESALGTAHIALGNSIAYGGTVDAVAHLDCVMRNATLEIDDAIVIAAGELA